MPKTFRTVLNTRDGSREIRDVDMPAAHNSNVRQTSYKKRGGGNQYVRPNNIRRLMDEDFLEGNANNRTNSKFKLNNSRKTKRTLDSEWIMVSVKFEKEVDKNVVLEAIKSNIAITFRPLKVRLINSRLMSFIVNNATAKILNGITGRITLQDGQKLWFKFSPAERPRTAVNDEVTAHMKKVMSKRYDIPMNYLDLSNFCNDTDFLDNDVFLNLKNKKVVDVILDIIGENIPELKTLNMSDNDLDNLIFFTNLPTKASKITSVNLTNNKLKDKKELRSLKKLKLEELSLTGNYFIQKFADGQDFSKAMRQLFPTLLKLDNNTLPPPIKFNTSNTELPAPQGSYFGQDNIQEMVCRFLRDYLEVYDANNRSLLINAYHEKACYSLTCYDLSKSLSSSRDSTPNMGIGAYYSASRNLRKVSSDETVKRLKTDRNEIINFLQTLALTTHDLNSLVVDVSHITTLMMVFNVKGIFQEASSSSSSSHTNQPILRQFNRTIVAVPFSNGLAIINEMVNISNLPLPNYAKYVESLKTKKVPETPSQPPTTTPVIHQGITPQQSDLVSLFSQQSGMNAQFSALCLAENEWNYEVAATKFTELNRVNAIPPEAFIK